MSHFSVPRLSNYGIFGIRFAEDACAARKNRSTETQGQRQKRGSQGQGKQRWKKETSGGQGGGCRRGGGPWHLSVFSEFPCHEPFTQDSRVRVLVAIARTCQTCLSNKSNPHQHLRWRAASLASRARTNRPISSMCADILACTLASPPVHEGCVSLIF